MVQTFRDEAEAAQAQEAAEDGLLDDDDELELPGEIVRADIRARLSAPHAQALKAAEASTTVPVPAAGNIRSLDE
ncbi:hypothetical protein ABTL41_19875, partial [Acinetobacter baumannii]